MKTLRCADCQNPLGISAWKSPLKPNIRSTNCSAAAGVGVFSDRPVDAETVRSLLEAARWAPSSYNEQPWSFLIATKENAAEFDAMLGCLVEFNQGWAKSAGLLVISVAHLEFNRNQKTNRHALHDTGLASENLVIQATALGLFAHGMAGFSMEKTREIYGIPTSHEPVAAWAIGYPGDPETLPAELRAGELAPRTRKPLESFVFSGSWSARSSLI